MCMWFYWNLKWPPQINFLNICDRKKSNLIYGGGWYRTLVLLLKSCIMRLPAKREIRTILFLDMHVQNKKMA